MTDKYEPMEQTVAVLAEVIQLGFLIGLLKKEGITKKNLHDLIDKIYGDAKD